MINVSSTIAISSYTSDQSVRTEGMETDARQRVQSEKIVASSGRLSERRELVKQRRADVGWWKGRERQG